MGIGVETMTTKCKLMVIIGSFKIYLLKFVKNGFLEAFNAWCLMIRSGKKYTQLSSLGIFGDKWIFAVYHEIGRGYVIN